MRKLIQHSVSKPSAQSGFTLIEVALAVLILGAGLTTLIALHTRYVNDFIIEQNTTRAALYAQYLLAMREARGETPELGEREDPLDSKLDSVGFFDGQTIKQQDLKLDGWVVHENVTSVDLPQLEDALRRIDLELSWGEKEDERFTVTYFAKSIPNTGGLSGIPGQ